ncbi:hypothetical protein RHSIM_Rhsim08G0118200 [Rhododendron simsii]|uniref:ZF-HD dimerization-type domain-containing protein n=1 Tax=Rhododendron simsii TaxID=118357 RepID=A0A834GII0_RHOSS|nr:hypothetical protein RHSIM_Rhsim08G0118200 [Rhododendron simsii]
MELRSGQEGIHRVSNSNLYHSHPNEGSSSKLSSASIATTVTDRRRNHGGTVLNPPQQTLDPHNSHDLLHPQSNNLPHHTLRAHHQQVNSNPDPDLVPPPPPPASDATIITSTSTASNSKPPPQPPPPQPQPSSLAPKTTATAPVQYRECLKNHAASTGGHVVDGCGEFMPAGEENTPEALRCAACDCHRNFHRREIQGEENNTPQIQSGNNNHTNYPYRITTTSHHHLPPPPHQQQQHNASRYAHGPIPPPVMMAFHGGAAAESSSEDLNVFHYNYNNNNNTNNNAGGTTTTTTTQAAKKRYRTKFSQGQKERMQEFAERVGWKMQKQDDERVEQFCDEVGIKRQVFKVWMHNNKAAMKRKQH